MKISKDTLQILKNFQNINRSLIVKAGNKIKTLTDTKTFYAEAVVDEEFPEFAVYDLNKLLSIIDIAQDPDCEFFDKYLSIINGRSETKFNFSDPSVLNLQLPTKEISLPDILAEFMISSKDLSDIDKISNKLSLPDLVVQKNDDDELIAILCDKKNSSANSHTIVLEQDKVYNSDLDISLNFKIESMKFLTGDYWVEISSAKTAKFSHQTLDLNYFLSLESDSVTK